MQSQIDMIKMCNQFQSTVDRLIEINRMQEKYYKPLLKHSMVPELYVMEFCTVGVDAGRMIGKTTYIREHANKDSLIIIPANEIRVFSYNKNIATVLSSKQVKNGNARNKVFTTIYVDDPFWVFKDISKEELYRELANKYVDQLFILLGNM